MTEQPTCEQRWQSHLDSTLDTLRGMYAAYIGEPRGQDIDEDGDCEYDRYSLPEYGLSFTYDKKGGYFDYCMSWGGPADYFHFYAEAGQYGYRCNHVEYCFQDWYDVATHEVTGLDGQFLRDLFDNYFSEMAPGALEEAG